MMRRAATLLLFVLLSAGLGAGVDSSVTANSIEPQPASPGDTVKVFVTAHNDGERATTFEPLSIETVPGVSVIGTTDSFREAFRLCDGCRLAGTVYLKVDEEAVSGTYPVDIELQHDAGAVVEKAAVEVDGTPDLTVNVPHTSVVPGENSSVTVTVENVGTDTATGTVLSLDGAFALYPTTVLLGRIPSGETVQRTVQLSVDDDTSSGLTHPVFQLTYNDEAEQQVEEQSFAVTVRDAAELVLADFSVGTARVGSVATATVQLENLGPGQATHIMAALACDGAEVVQDRDFVGQIGDEESVPITFRVHPTSGQVQCRVTATYEDSTDRTLEASFGFPAQSGMPLLPLLVAAVAVVGAAYLWKRRNDAAAAV